jgi:cell wall-associated NlpC family hydrolase
VILGYDCRIGRSKDSLTDACGHATQHNHHHNRSGKARKHGGKAKEGYAEDNYLCAAQSVGIVSSKRDSHSKEEIEACFSVGETAEEEIARLAAEEAARIAAEQARLAAEKAAAEAARAGKRQALVEYANQFIGNPYVYGGTSLTRGTDCSGFVKGVYAHFGVSLPRTSYSMRSVGYAVSFSDIQPGDIVCYSGHVGIYAGNGKIVNAIDESHGIGMSNVKYSTIITIRRIF